LQITEIRDLFDTHEKLNPGQLLAEDEYDDEDDEPFFDDDEFLSDDDEDEH